MHPSSEIVCPLTVTVLVSVTPRTEMYVNEVQNKTCDGNAEPVVLKESSATAWVDGNNGLGPVVGNFCMALAMQKAKESGVGWVVAKGSNHYGIASWYSTQALQQGLLVRKIPVLCFFFTYSQLLLSAFF